MAGFLEKDKRLIDYKLTEFGRDKLSSGSLSFKYYTFSDSNIVYNENTNSNKSFKVSDLSSYLPFEVDVNVSNIINPEYNLSSVISFDQLDNNILFVNKESNSTLSDHLFDLKLIDNKNLVNENDNREIFFDFKDEKDEFDFGENTRTSSYPTVKHLSTNITNLEYVHQDKRFEDKIRNKFLPVENSSKDFTQEELNKLNKSNIEILFKRLSINELIPSINNKEDFVVELIKTLEKNNKIFKLDYVLNEEKMIDEDVFLFELHKIKNDQTNLETLEKLSFVKLGEFYDKKEFNFKQVYLIGKLFLTRNIKDRISEENRRLYYSINNDYSFVNMFTLVIE